MGLESVGIVQAEQLKSKLEKTAKAAGVGAVFGAVTVGGFEYGKQKSILTKSAKSVLPEQIRKSLEKFNVTLGEIGDVISRGKIDFKAVGKRALVGAGVFALLFGAWYSIGRAIMDAFRDDKKPETAKQDQKAQKAK